MKTIFTFLLLTVVIPLQTIQPADTIPAANAQIVEYVKTVIGTKVDRGECWDLANEALKLINADWDHAFKYGRLLNPDKDTVYPGDLVQFKNVKVEYKVDGRTTAKESMAQHTAIIYVVNGKGDYILAHQNTGFSGRKVGTSRFVLKTIKHGKVWIYRPVVKM